MPTPSPGATGQFACELTTPAVLHCLRSASKNMVRPGLPLLLRRRLHQRKPQCIQRTLIHARPEETGGDEAAAPRRFPCDCVAEPAQVPGAAECGDPAANLAAPLVSA